MHSRFSSRCSRGLRLAALVLLGLCALAPQAARAQQTLYVANVSDNTISRITPAGVVSTFATGLSSPIGLAFDSSGNLYAANNNVSDNTISRITPAGVVSTFASGLSRPLGLAFDSSGNLYVGNNNTISKITPAGGVSQFASGLNGPEFLVFSPPPVAHTYVSHAGTDTGNCSRSAPCATFAYALTQTLPGGTVTAVNAGEYGPMMITQAVTIDGEGTQAGITAPGGGDGITINAAATDTVVLRGLSITVQSSSIRDGIRLNTGNLVVDDCHISGVNGFSTDGIGLSGAGTCLVENTTVTNCFTGLVDETTGAVSLRHVTLSHGVQGLFVPGTGRRADIEDSQITQNVSIGLDAGSGGTISASGCTLSGNGTAVYSRNVGIIRLTNNDIYNNQTALNANNGGIISTTGNNRRAGNKNTATPFAPSDQPNRGIAVQ